MPCIVDDEESIFLIVLGYEICDCSIGLNLRKYLLPTINDKALHLVVISIAKNALKTLDLGIVSYVGVRALRKTEKFQKGGVTSSPTAISSHSGCHDSKSTETCL
jgi:hypothetical protein